MLKEKFEQYLRVEKRYSPLTIEAYRKDLAHLSDHLATQFHIDLFESEKLNQLNHRILRNWMGQLLAEGLSSRSVARKVSAAKTYFGFVRKSGLLDQNPAARLKVPSFEKKLPSFLKEKEVEALFSAIEYPESFEGFRDRCMLEIFYGCGLRRSELINLQNNDVDLYEQHLKIEGKGNKQRIVPFGKAVKQAIVAYLDQAEKSGISTKKSFFIRKNGEPLYPKLVYRTVNKYLSSVSSLQQRSPHVLRHTFATHMLDNGADLNAIKEFLGHESLAATQVYTHNTISKLKSIHQQAHPRAQKHINNEL